ncbi:uncharacterized protein LOC113234841 [Hyposmocoma kahamanoa]|uniref:uncharacterized protein LOC113234841 n=1 Tax=Hyposmocoma kahamanoa TaxID=1477025 RepID=UPI000E6D6A10|nr:uncharacterized protein LOC113234841 [Hyposmocoma kahamanoa]
MGSPIAPVVANIFMEWFEDTALVNISFEPRYWWRYVDDVFAIMPKEGAESLLAHLNSVHPKITFTVECEQNGVLPFFDVLVRREHNGRLSHAVYQKATHTDRYLRADSHHHPAHLASVLRTLINRALKLCDPDYIDAELNHVKVGRWEGCWLVTITIGNRVGVWQMHQQGLDRHRQRER